jgi:CRP/FNR family cyclic AMP-dependent transcriptional regulator
MMEHYQLLAGMPVFGGLNETTLELLTRLAKPMALVKGEHFFHEGDESQAMYVLQSGQVEIYKSWQGRSQLLRCMNAGDCFGEMALVDLFPRSASARVLEPCEALEITPSILAEVFRHDLEQFTLLQMNIGREISRRLRRVDELLFRAVMGEDLPESSINDLT